MGKKFNLFFLIENQPQIIFYFTDFCVSHHLTIAQFSLAIVSIIESKRIIIAYKINVIKRTFLRVMFKCIQTIIVRIQQSIKKVFNDTEPRKSAWFSIAFSMVNVQHISIVVDVNTRSKIKLTWVSSFLS